MYSWILLIATLTVYNDVTQEMTMCNCTESTDIGILNVNQTPKCQLQPRMRLHANINYTIYTSITPHVQFKELLETIRVHYIDRSSLTSCREKASNQIPTIDVRFRDRLTSTRSWLPRLWDSNTFSQHADYTENIRDAGREENYKTFNKRRSRFIYKIDVRLHVIVLVTHLSWLIIIFCVLSSVIWRVKQKERIKCVLPLFLQLLLQT